MNAKYIRTRPIYVKITFVIRSHKLFLKKLFNCLIGYLQYGEITALMKSNRGKAGKYKGDQPSLSIKNLIFFKQDSNILVPTG